jgi:hypothetical protein
LSSSIVTKPRRRQGGAFLLPKRQSLPPPLVLRVALAGTFLLEKPERELAFFSGHPERGRPLATWQAAQGRKFPAKLTLDREPFGLVLLNQWVP